MKKMKIKEGNHDEMQAITDFLISEGFTPVYGLEKSNFQTDDFGVHDEGGGWRSFKGQWIWKCVEPIPRNLIEAHFDLPKTVRLCHFPDHPELGVAIASDFTYESIKSSAIDEKHALNDAHYDTGTEA